jgi:hypothetical protein
VVDYGLHTNSVHLPFPNCHKEGPHNSGNGQLSFEIGVFPEQPLEIVVRRS